MEELLSGPPGSEMVIEPIPENLFREPLEYISADHYRQRTVCRLVDAIAADPDGDDASSRARAVLDYLETEMPQHIADEEQGLFARLRDSSEGEDDLENLVTLLVEEHADDRELAADLIEPLRHIAAGEGPPDAAVFSRAAALYCETQRRHLAWEEVYLLPLARKRLTSEDIAELGRGMAARRGIEYPA
jgi:hemerythrin-like domain-containing protein